VLRFALRYKRLWCCEQLAQQLLVYGRPMPMEEIIAEHTGQPLERVSKDMERDYFMTPEEARNYGIIDRVIAHH
jgi:ATP-dependent protease ClpP protease subunit